MKKLWKRLERPIFDICLWGAFVAAVFATYAPAEVKVIGDLAAFFWAALAVFALIFILPYNGNRS